MEFTKEIKFNVLPIKNEAFTITYNGFLKDSSELTIVYGFGESWENTTELKMNKIENGFSAEVKLLDFDTFNFCFRDSNNVWDNNSNCNYIANILPCHNERIDVLFDRLLTPTKAQTFDIDSLIEELLQPIVSKSTIQDVATVEIETQPIDLGAELSRILSEIDYSNSTENLATYSNLDEILSQTVIDETPLELFETSRVDEIVSQLIENSIGTTDDIADEILSSEPEHTSVISEEKYKYYSEINSQVTDIINKIEESENAEEKSLLVTENTFSISPRQLSRFYLAKKRLKLALYKLFVKIPKLILGLDN